MAQPNQSDKSAPPVGRASRPVTNPNQTAMPPMPQASKKEQQSIRNRNIVLMVILIGFGIFMLVAPDAAAGQEASGRRALMKQILILIWGIPGGIVLIALGGFLGYRTFKK